MRWLLLALWLFGAALYATRTDTFTSSSPRREFQRLAAQTTLQAEPELKSESAALQPSARELLRKKSPESSSNTLETEIPARHPSDDIASVKPALPTVNAEEVHQAWGRLMRAAPVHSSPSVSSPIVGYAAAGTQMQLVERHSGWVKVLDSATSREGWIYEIYLSPIENPGGIAANVGTREAALESDMDIEVPRPSKTLKSKKARNSYAEKRRKRFGLFFRFRRF